MLAERSVSPLPGTRTRDAVIGSDTPRRWASVTGTRSGLATVGGFATNSFTVPELITIRTSSDFSSVTMRDA